jgi:hypothetical protein
MLSSLFRPKLTSLTEQLQEPVSLCDVKKDIAAVTFDVEQEGMGEQVRPRYRKSHISLTPILNGVRKGNPWTKYI